MITVGLVRELHFIAKAFQKEIVTKIIIKPTLPGKGGALYLEIKPQGHMDVWYKGERIWKELIDGDDSFFGIESCDSISRIIACIHNHDNSWREKYLSPIPL